MVEGLTYSEAAEWPLVPLVPLEAIWPLSDETMLRRCVDRGWGDLEGAWVCVLMWVWREVKRVESRKLSSSL